MKEDKKYNRAAGVDQLPRVLLKYVGDALARELLLIMAKEADLPDEWMEGVV